MGLDQTQLEQFREQGFLVVPGVLTRDQTAQLRAALDPEFDRPAANRLPGDVDGLLFDPFSRHAAVRWLLFHPPTLEILRSVLGDDFVVLREAVAQREQFGHWHKDTTSQEKAGLLFHYDDDFLMLEAAYYLQDQTAEYGGGLEVEPGSHRDRADRYAHRSVPARVLGRMFGGPPTPNTVTQIESREGDLVLFDFRVTHRATRGSAKSRPPGKEKIAIFQACSRNTPHVQQYTDFIGTRPAYVYLHGFAWPTEVRELAEANGVTLG